MHAGFWKTQRRKGESQKAHGTRILNTYRSLVGKGDLPNALEMWDAYIPFHFREVVSRPEGHDFTLPSILSSFMPKSGGTFIHNRMVHNAGYGDFWWGITHPQSGSTVYASPDGIRTFMLGGFTCHTHFLPQPQVMSAINAARYDAPIWVHIRNPVDCVLSGYHHYKGSAQGTGATREQRIARNQKEAEFLALDLSDIDAFARRHIHFYVEWIREWAEFDLARPGCVYFTFFDQIADTSALLNEVISAFGGSEQARSISAELHSDRLREAGERRPILSEATRADLERVVTDRLGGFSVLDRLLA